jgi:hypothetical protein
LAEHVARGSGALLDGVLPMLDTDVATEEGLIVIRDVSCGIDTNHVRLTVFVDDYAVIDPDAAICQRVDRRLDADAGDDEIALEALAGFRDNSAYASFPLESGD